MTTNIQVSMYDDYIKYVDWLKENQLPVAITLTEILEPSNGKDAIIFPPTFATKEKIPYQIDYYIEKTDHLPHQEEELNTCLIDSVGSQANRMESCFKNSTLSQLVPQIEVLLESKEKKEKPVNLLDIGHRIADGVVRFSELHETIQNAIIALRDEANAEFLAKLAPTSLIFGFWDSRPDTSMYKFSRMLSSTIRATNVFYVKRSAQFNPAFPSLNEHLENLGEDSETEAGTEQNSSKDEKNPLSQIGLLSAPSTNTHGGVRVFGQIVRRTQINLVGLRALAVTKKNNDSVEVDVPATLKLRRYLLGLALVAGKCQNHYNLREGCLLVCSNATSQLVYNGKASESFNWNIENAFEYAHQTAKDFGVGENKKINFDLKKVQDKVKEIQESKKKKTSKKK